MITKRNKGYSMLVLIIAIIVMLILAGVSISSLQTAKERTEIMNFILDMQTIEERIKNYYVETGTLPTTTSEYMDAYEIAYAIEEDVGAEQGAIFLSQLSQYDDDRYYIVDLNQLKGLSLKESYRGIEAQKENNIKDNGYIVNGGSLKVYVEKGVRYKAPSDQAATTYYTLTSKLVNGQEQYRPLEEEVLITGNPQTWVSQAELRVLLPVRSLAESSWNDWTFKWDFGPKTKQELEEIPSTNTRKNFKYGQTLIVKSNGIYSFYIKDPEGSVTLRNISVNKIDDISPKYKFLNNGNKLSVYDDETGIKYVKFKKLSEYNANVEQARSEAESGGDVNSAARTEVDYYLMDGVGSDVVYEFESLIKEYLKAKKEVYDAIDDENDYYDRWMDEHPVDSQLLITQEDRDNKTASHTEILSEYNRKIDEINQQYAYLYDVNGSTDESRLVLYIEDNAGNGTVVGDKAFISTSIIADSYNIDISALME